MGNKISNITISCLITGGFKNVNSDYCNDYYLFNND